VGRTRGIGLAPEGALRNAVSHEGEGDVTKRPEDSGHDQEGARPGDDTHAGGRSSDGRTPRLEGSDLYRAVGLLFLLTLILLNFEPIARVLLLAFLASIVAIAMNKVVSRLPMPRGLATAVTALAVVGGMGGGLYFLATAVAREVRALVDQAPELLEAALVWEERLREEVGLDLELLGPRALELVQRLPALLLQAVGLLELIALGALLLFGAFFIVAKPNEGLLTPFLRVVPRETRGAWRRMFRLLGDRLGGWLVGTLASMVIIGTVSVIAFMLLGTPYPLLLGVLIGVLEILPLVGPWIGGAIAVVVTLFHDPGLALWVALVVILIQEAEGNLVHPMVMRGAVAVHPFVTLLALLLFGSIFGLLGAILSLPLVLAIQTAVQVLWVENTLGTADDEIEPVVRD
jgi:predicted PurR-regulated permease PerM